MVTSHYNLIIYIYLPCLIGIPIVTLPGAGWLDPRLGTCPTHSHGHHNAWFVGAETPWLSPPCRMGVLFIAAFLGSIGIPGIPTRVRDTGFTQLRTSAKYGLPWWAITFFRLESSLTTEKPAKNPISLPPQWVRKAPQWRSAAQRLYPCQNWEQHHSMAYQWLF